MLAHLDSEYRKRHAKAQELAMACEREAERLKASGVDFSNKAATGRLEQLRAEYDRVNAAAGEAKDALLVALGREAKAVLLGEGVGEDFIKNIAKGGLSVKSALDATSGGTGVRAFYDPGIRELPQRKLFVRSVLPVRQATGDRVQYVRQTVANHAAAIVPAGDEKPRSEYKIERVEAQIVTIAHTTEAIDRALVADLDSIINFLNDQLTLGVRTAEEDEILNGPGPEGSPDHLLGLMNLAEFDVERDSAESNADAVYRAVTTIRENFSEPDAIILNPQDWAEIRLSKGDDGQYLAAPIILSDPDRLWGLPVVTSPVMAQGHGLVGDFQNGAAWYDREDARIDFASTGLGDNPGEELFSRNQLRWRGESRGTLACFFPQKFVTLANLGPVVQPS
jgi:HK97 family phage major capsid protein